MTRSALTPTATRQGLPRLRQVPFGDLCLLRRPADAAQRQIQLAQIDQLVRLVPLTAGGNMIAAAATMVCLWPDFGGVGLAAWGGLIIFFCLIRLVRVVRLGRNPDYARAKPASIGTILPPIAFLSLLWVVPAFVWYPAAQADAQVTIALILFGLASGACVTLSTVPLAALIFVAVVALTGFVGHWWLGQPTVMLMILVYGLMLAFSALWNARQFVSYLRVRLELEEQAELVGLLREFEASGSNWLWQLDADQRLVKLSRDMQHSFERPYDEVVGQPIFALLDPHGEAAQVSTGMRALGDAMRQGDAFRDLAIPVLGGKQWWTLSGKPVRDAEGAITGWSGVGSDITATRLSGGDSLTAARHDPMTGLANRLLVRELLEEALLRRASDDECCALMLVDLDRFKLVNDTLGHEIGDRLLCEVARRLRLLEPGPGVGRIGGDEFAMVVPSGCTRAALSARAEEVIVSLSAPYRIGGAELNIGATIGIAVAPTDGSTQEAMTRSADLALYSAKRAGRGSYHFFAGWMAEQAAASRTLESDLRSALKGGELLLAYQPIVHARSHKIIAREALLRWTHPTRGEVPPDQFVPVIEDAGLIGQVGNMVLREACREAARWPDQARVAVNVSSAQLASGPALVGHVIQALASSGLAAERLELEVTESLFLAGDSTTRATLEQLRALGIRLVLDDFGMGYSNYACLTTGAFSKLKIDRSFTVAACREEWAGERAIVESIITLARGLRMEVTAEGIETIEQAASMRTLGCGQLQGYLFGRPVIPQSHETGAGTAFRPGMLRPRAA